MVRSRVIFALLAIAAGATGTQGIDWTFWDDDDDSTSGSDSSSLGTSTLSPEELGSSYLDMVNDLLKNSSSSSSASATDAPTSSSSSDDTDDTDDETPAPDSSSSGSSSLALVSGSSSLDTTTMANNLATPATATSTITSTHRNWVGPWTLSPDSACYREAHIMDTCPSNYDRNDLTNTCWTECPLTYPVECGMSCIQQNNDCGREILAKTTAVAMSTLSMATFGVFGELAKLDPQTSQAKLLMMLYQTNNVVTDIPIAIYACMGKNVPPNLRMTQGLLATSQFLLLQILGHDDSIISSWDKFKAFLKGVNFTEATEEITEGEISNLETAMQQNNTCGADMKSMLDRTWQMVNEYRAETPDISDGELRLKISESDLVLYDIPTVTNNCMDEMTSESTETTAYSTREKLRKTFGVIINDLIKSEKSDNGTSIEAKETAYKWIDNGLTLLSISLLEPTDISTLLAEFIQTICGPTQFMGEIDDGTEDATLGLNALKKAFKGSSSSWTKKGDGAVIINFTSKDTKDVTVNIMSGGDKIDKVDVAAGSTATWKSNVTALAGKTLYLDRWRPGFLGLPGTGGGSLVLWVPIARQGGHLEIEAQLNVS
ncbi:hypothetical protein BBP00_00002421 [Phytophthora kernoviae]|uniref:Uncharacterized protein n=1 Tax=Phytophthora kernoviae TaxID=325452 RepID=A0A3F2RXH2_9STRA|nr:hypothetical protein BBP00_00002421 [Phytophthora kernoviae]